MRFICVSIFQTTAYIRFIRCFHVGLNEKHPIILNLLYTQILQGSFCIVDKIKLFHI